MSPSTGGLLPASPELTDRLVLSRTQVTAGTPIGGTLLVTNHGRVAINLTHGCRPQYAVVLTSRAKPLRVAFGAACSVAPFIINPGVNRLPFTIETTYPTCAREHPMTLMPVCRHTNGLMPSLPAGHYDAILIGSGLALPAPAPVPVLLTAPR